MGSYEHEMMDEVREARRALTKARLAESEARTAYRDSQAERATKERALEEILDSIATGDTGRGLLDLADRNRQARETADERQRGATAVERPKVRKAKLQGAARVPTATVEAPDEAERVGCNPFRPGPTAAVGLDAPSSFIGDPSEFAKFLGPIEPAPSPLIPDPEELDAPASDDDWAATPLAMVVARDDLVAMLKNVELRTLGDLADSCDWCGSLEAALEDFTPADVETVEFDVRTWAAGRPGFPLEKLPAYDPDKDEDGPERYWPVVMLGTGEVLGIVKASCRDLAFEAGERRFPHRRPLIVGEPSDSPPPGGSDAIEEALKAALFHDGVDPGWKQFRAEGIADARVAELLSGLWPERHEHRPGEDGGPGYTVIGGTFPVFWIGDVSGPGPKPPGLDRAKLADAVRLVLRIPDWGDVERPAAARPEKPRKAAKRKKAETAGAGS